MNRIHTIKIKNFKAFDQLQAFELNGRHLLVYGENGSGKSSLFWALYTFLQSSIKDKDVKKYFDRDDKENLLNLYTDDDDSWIDVSFTRDAARFYRLSKDGLVPNEAADPIVRDTNLASDFITHRLLVNFYNFRNSQEVDLFPAFKKDILPFLLTSEQEEFGPMYQEIVRGRPYRVTSKGAIRYATKRSWKHYSYMQSIEKFNAEMVRLIENINQKATPFLTQHFNVSQETIRLYLEYRPMQYTQMTEKRSYGGADYVHESRDTRELREPFIKLTVKQLVDGEYEEIERPQSFLNEARLTAIALAIRFAILDDKLKIESQILGLDDLLISLDMTHRDKVLDLVLDKYALGYQLMLLTHDRSFFNLAKKRALQKFPRDKWLFLEMYIDDFSKDYVVPRVRESEDYQAQAMGHLSRGDYPSAGNALRKRSEDIIASTLPQKVLKDRNGNDVRGLAIQIIQAKLFFGRLNKDVSLLNQLERHLGTLLNPLSHRDDQAQVFREELREIIRVLDDLEAFVKTLKYKEILSRATPLRLELVKTADLTNVYELTLKDDLYVVESSPGVFELSIAACETECCYEVLGGVKQQIHPLKLKHLGLKEMYEAICQHEEITPVADYSTVYKTSEGQTLNTLTVI